MAGGPNFYPNTLSRLPGLKPKNDSDARLRHRFCALIPEHKVHPDLFHKPVNKDQNIDHLYSTFHQTSLTEAISQACKENETAQSIIDYLKNTTKRRWPGPLRSLLRKDKAEFKVSNGFVYFRKRIFIPDYENLSLKILCRSHSSIPTGHPGRVKTLDLLQRTYWWP
ncbi:hypothetical protein EV44_g3434 [Erysiphe necator]|uniref:Integrase zinc-binding domain-containing protein n=1 Tax=Uncinula necator TaxID=52586 RepID=A0A0B1P3U7_UNCNE|nr:hypothetical protein EV44_g3434 [Erysiphe necator]